MSKTITRFRKKTVPFTMVSNNALHFDMHPSAFKIYCMIQHYITMDNFNLNKSFLIKQCKMAESTFDKYFKELRKVGFLKSYQYPGITGDNSLTIEYELLDVADTTTPYHIVYNSIGEIVQEFSVEESSKKVSKKENSKKVPKSPKADVEPVSEESCTPPNLRGVQNVGGSKRGELNNTNINTNSINIDNNTNINNTNNLSIYPNTNSINKNYCSLQEKEIVERQIERLKEYIQVPSYTKWDYKKLLNASKGDEELVMYVYDNVLKYLVDNGTSVNNTLAYLLKSIEQELKKI